MAFDGFVEKAVIEELNSVLAYGKVQKVFEPTKNEIILGIYSAGHNYVLVINIASNQCYMHLTTTAKPNPLVAPNFCMLLRKHLLGSKIVSITNLGLERIAEITFETYNELNDIVTKKLMVELMGKHSNLILVNENNTIIDSLRHLEKEEHSVRDILPARQYVLPPITKADLLGISSFDEFCSILQQKQISSLEDISACFSGISKSMLQYLQKKLYLTTLSSASLKALWTELQHILSCMTTHHIVLEPIRDGKDYVLETTLTASNSLCINWFLDDFYTAKEKAETFTQYRNTVLKLILAKLKKLSKKLEGINSKLAECEKIDTYRMYGELLTANLYQLPKENTSSVTVSNYYENGKEITIPLDPKLTPSANSKAFFKKYHKLKNTLEIVEKQKQETKQEMDYLESIVYELESSDTIQAVDAIYEEMVENGVVERKEKTSSKVKKVKNNPRLPSKIGTAVRRTAPL